MNEKIDISEIKKGIKFSIDNAFELIEEAEILFENKKYARTYSLSQLALEEIGKSVILFDLYHTLQADDRHKIDFKKLNKNFKDHKSKTFELLIVGLIMKGKDKIESAEFEKIASKNLKEIQRNKSGYFDKLKNESLYVSYNKKKFEKPSELISKEKSSKFLSDVKSKIEFSSEDTLKWLRMDEWLGADKEGILTDLQNDLNK